MTCARSIDSPCTQFCTVYSRIFVGQLISILKDKFKLKLSIINFH